MSKHKKILLAVTKGGMSQSEVAASLHVSKRDVSAAACRPTR
jgi:predicted XRE-type DNA-binding protein